MSKKVAISAAENWKSKIVGKIQWVDPRTLLPNEKNFRVHPDNQASALLGRIEDVGWIDIIKVNQNTGHIVDGHLRVRQAIEQGQPVVPVVYLDLTEEEEAKALLYLDPQPAWLAGWRLQCGA